jgi:RNA polymerase sigma factor (sigma-70 family)
MPDDQKPRSTTLTRIGLLLERINAGDQEAREELFEVSLKRFQQIAHKLLNRPKFQDLRKKGIRTDDVLNETLLERIFKSNKLGQDLLDQQQFDDPAKFIGAVANHMAYCLKDIAGRRGPALARQRKQATNAPAKEGGAPRVEEAVQPSKTAENRRDAQLMEMLEAMDQLEEKEQEVLRLRYLLQMSREEVAATLGVATKTVTRHTAQALERLREINKDDFLDA